jgi:hypothetical protein
LHDIIARYHAWAAQTVARHGGYIAKYMGDGVLVYFGYPQAHEYDAEEAVRTGLALVDAVGEIRGPQRLQIRVGIASGLVVIGDLTGCGKSRDFEKMAMERARYRNEGHIRSMAYGRAPGDEWQRNDDQSTFSASC